METTIGVIILLMIPVLGLIFSIIYYFIILHNRKKYKKVIVNQITAYRNKHPRCRYCKYCYLLKIPANFGHDIYKCKLKDKYIKFFNYNFCGCFCDYFELENLDD